MRKRGVVLLLFVLVIGVGSLFLRNSQGSEPHYGGRSLTDWGEVLRVTQFQKLQLRPFTTANFGGHESPVTKQMAALTTEEALANEAIRAIGTNAILHLTEWIRAESRRPTRLRLLLMKAHLYSFGSLSAKACAAPAAFGVLGSTAASAIPELEEIVSAFPGTQAPYRAIDSLCAIGPSSIPALMRLATQTNIGTHLTVFRGLKKMGTNAAPAIPHLTALLNHSVPEIQMSAVQALGKLRLSPDLTVPALVSVVQSGDKYLRMKAAMSLGNFGQLARPAVPALLEARRSLRANEFMLIDEALHMIDPTAFAEPPPPR